MASECGGDHVEARERRAVGRGGAASRYQMEFANDSNSYIEIRFFCRFFEQWKTATMADPP